MRRIRSSAVILTLLVLAAIGVARPAAATAGRRGQVVTLVPGGTTTLAPTTVGNTAAPTTVAAPTTTAAPATTTPTTSNSSSSTTTVAPAAAATSDSSSTPWGWIIGILAVVALVLIAVLLVMRRRAALGKETTWKDSAASALRDADLTRDMLADEARPGESEDAARLSAVRASVDRVATSFDQLASRAPNDDMRRHSTAVATSLRGYFFALEAEQMLHQAPTAPTAEQLATADSTKRLRVADLDAAVDAIRSYVAPDKPA